MIKNFIGMSQNELVFQEIKDGVIRGFSSYSPMELVNGDLVLSMSSWTHDVSLDFGIQYTTGMAAAPMLDIPDEYSNAYECDTVSCEECGAVHNSDDCTGQSMDPTWTIVGECAAVCLGCRTADDALTLIENPKDLFRAKNCDMVVMDGYEEIDTLFCDSSGFGSTGERALTKKQAIDKVSEMMAEHGEMYAGVTGIGQFQVYVTLYRKTA